MPSPERGTRAKLRLTEVRDVIVLALFAALLANPGAAAEATPDQRYADCLAATVEDPEAAYESAQSWERDGGGRPARHCAALSLYALGHYREAAERLETLAEELNRSDRRLTVAALGQAGQAWLAAGELKRALAVQSAALRLTPDNVELLIDRGIAWAAAEKFPEAITDLSHAVKQAPKRAEIRILRAAAHRKAGNREQARADVEIALKLEPDNPEGLLERGLLRRLEGDTDGARADWLDLLAVTEEGPLAEAARRHLEELEVNTN